MLASGNDSTMLRSGLGSAYFNDKSYQQAIPHLQKYIEIDENYSAAYKLLGHSQIKLNLKEQERSSLEAGLKKATRHGDKQTEILIFLKKLGS